MNGSDLLRYARVHRAVTILAGVTVVALLSAFFGGTRIALPSIGSASLSTGVPYRQELPLLSAVFLTAAFGGAMSAHEETGTRTMHRVHNAYCIALTLTTCALSFGTEAFAVGPERGVVFVRSVLIWLGLALLSVRLLGQQLGWVIPMASTFLLIWYPLNWWDWTVNPADDPFSWVVAAVALAMGTAATAATPWRRKVLLPRRR
ncbi:hypothetical protein ABTX77_14700 [Streptomyces sp. NPDC097704]|uniref:hypothetical protein n=1 Tax=Streptomyces sp. NPDC097704 TaxID=3157101 RepID=UPI00332DDECF